MTVPAAAVRSIKKKENKNENDIAQIFAGSPFRHVGYNVLIVLGASSETAIMKQKFE
jgi:hypothetical protein